MKYKIVVICFLMSSITCLANAVKSVNGAVHSRFSSVAEESVSAKDYVQDGLIGQWDGIENAGYGKHDYESNEWVDLIGGNNFINLEYGKWSDNCWVNSGDVANMRSFAPKDFITIEIVICQSPTYNRGAVRKVVTVSPYGGTRSIFINPQGDRVLVHNNSNLPCAYFENGVEGKIITASFVYSSKEASAQISKAYNNGARSCEVGYTTWNSNIYFSKGGGNILILGDDTNYGSGDSMCFSIRLYDRELSDEEVAYNHTIDKARFNVP